MSVKYANEFDMDPIIKMFDNLKAKIKKADQYGTMKGPRKREASQPAYDLRFRAPFGCTGRWS